MNTTVPAAKGLGSPRGGLVAATVALWVANGLLWATVVPPWQAPDEPKHFAFIRMLKEQGPALGRAPNQDVPAEIEKAILRSMDETHFWWYGRAPKYDAASMTLPGHFSEVWMYGTHTAVYRSSPAYYALAATVQPAAPGAGFYGARFLSVVLGALIVVFTAGAARELFPSDTMVRYGAPLFVALHPGFAFSQMAVNSDALANAAAAFVLLLVARLVSRGASPARLVAMAFGLAAAVLVKRTTVFLVPVAGLALVGWWFVHRRQGPHRRLALASIVAALVAGVAGLVTLGQAVPLRWRWTGLRYFFNEPDQPGRIVAYLHSPAAWPLGGRYLARLVDGFWGSFGWDIVRLPGVVYGAFALVVLGVVVGCVRRIHEGGDGPAARTGLVLLGAAPAVAAGAALAFFVSYLYLPYAPPPQGRYLMPAMLPIAILVMAGLGAWVPAARRWPALRVFVATMTVYDLVALFGFVGPYFYG
ncbi:MAG: DUF2142 domain-containing protein [Anaerolineae bacterium]